MSDKPDSEEPSGQGTGEGPQDGSAEDSGLDTGDRRTQPPYPGWSVQQPPGPSAPPPQRGWTSPSGQQASGQQPSDQRNSGQSEPGTQPSVQPERPDTGTGWTSPATPGSPASGGPAPGETTPPGSGGPGWGPAQGWQWAPPTVKPGVIPLRPLGVGEILDGAVTTIRRNPAPMLGLSALVAAAVQLLGLLLTWLIFRDVVLPTDPTTADTFLEMFGVTALALGGVGFLIIAIVDWIATVILTGMLTIVVSRAVLGEKITISDAWQRARPRVLRLLGLTIVYALIVATPAIVTIALMLFAAAAGAPDAVIGLAIVAIFVMVPLTVWLFVRYALAVPALMLESMLGPTEPRRIGIGKALRRSAELVKRSWWRIFGILILIWIVATIVSYAVSLLFSVPTYFFVDPMDPLTATGMEALTLGALSGIVSTAITAPFLAGAVALLYIDRRIRREALDIDLARAAGVSIPGRTDQPPPTP